MAENDWSKREYESYWQGQPIDLSLDGYCRNKRLAELFRKDERVLDLGAGYGAVANFLRRERRCQMVGLELSAFGCQHMTSALNIPSVRADAAGTLPFRDGSFDAVFWGDNIEHLLDPMSALLEIKRVTRPGGRIVITCPNAGSFRYRWRYLVYGIVWNVEASGNPPWAWQHIRFFNQSVMRRMVETAGLRVSRFLGAHDGAFLDLVAQRWPCLVSPVIIAEVRRD